MANCGNFACMDCSSFILNGLIDHMVETKASLLDIGEMEGILGPELQKDCVYDWFRVCPAHCTFPEIPVLLNQHADFLKALLDEKSPRFHPWIMAVTAPRRPRVFPFITHYPRILDTLAPGTLLHGLVHDARSSMCALRSLEDSSMEIKCKDRSRIQDILRWFPSCDGAKWRVRSVLHYEPVRGHS